MSGVTLPVSSAAVAVTTLKVEPGGYSSCVVRFRSGWFGSLLMLAELRTGSGSGRTPGSTPSRAPCRSAARAPPRRPCARPGRPRPPACRATSRFVTTSLPSRSRLSRPDRIEANSSSLPVSSSLRLQLDAAPAVRDERVADRVRERAARWDRCACRCGSRRGPRRGCARARSCRRRRGSARAGSSAPRSAAGGCRGCPRASSASNTVQRDVKITSTANSSVNSPNSWTIWRFTTQPSAPPAPRSARGRTRSGAARAAPCSRRSSCRRRRRTAASRR